MDTKSWNDIKENVYSIKGTEIRDVLERDIETSKIGLQLKRPVKKNTSLKGS